VSLSLLGLGIALGGNSYRLIMMSIALLIASVTVTILAKDVVAYLLLARSGSIWLPLVDGLWHPWNLATGCVLILSVLTYLILINPATRSDCLSIVWMRQFESRVCPVCHYSLIGNRSGVCPECGLQSFDSQDKCGFILPRSFHVKRYRSSLALMLLVLIVVGGGAAYLGRKEARTYRLDSGADLALDLYWEAPMSWRRGCYFDLPPAAADQYVRFARQADAKSLTATMRLPGADYSVIAHFERVSRQESSDAVVERFVVEVPCTIECNFKNRPGAKITRAETAQQLSTGQQVFPAVVLEAGTHDLHVVTLRQPQPGRR
jgi:hypothetical protein